MNIEILKSEIIRDHAGQPGGVMRLERLNQNSST